MFCREHVDEIGFVASFGAYWYHVIRRAAEKRLSQLILRTDTRDWIQHMMSQSSDGRCSLTIDYTVKTDKHRISGLISELSKEASKFMPTVVISEDKWEGVSIIADSVEDMNILSSIVYELMERSFSKRSERIDACWIRNKFEGLCGNTSSPYGQKTPTRGKRRNKQTLMDGSPLVPKTVGQKNYLKAMEDNIIVFCQGPAGTGKTWLAVSYAVKCLLNKETKKIIMTRPVVEAQNEHLGFLPGGIEEKLDPYMRPLFDALSEMVGIDKVTSWVEEGIIEIAPLAYMRGRTFNDSIIIADEMQNSNPEQMRMLLTRLGYDTKCIVTGDPSQSDTRKKSGLKDGAYVCSTNKVPDVGYVQMGSVDIVRSPIAAHIADAYDNEDKAIERASEN